MKKNVTVLYGGSSSEREVSLDTGRAIINSLDRNKYNVKEILIPKNKSYDWIKDLIDSKTDIVIIGLHGGLGENGSIQGLLECLHIPYVGSKVLGSSIGMDKFVSKQLLNDNNITVPKGILLTMEDEYDSSILKGLTYPLVIKPNTEGSSVGVKIASNLEELEEKLHELRDSKNDVIIEEYIKGQEITCGVIETKDGLVALGVLDITAVSSFYDYHAKYETNDTSIVPSRLPKKIQENIQSIAKKVFKVLDSKGYARVDMIVKNDIPYVLETNTLPGMTSHSLIPKSLKEQGISYSEFLDDLIENELKRK